MRHDHDGRGCQHKTVHIDGGKPGLAENKVGVAIQMTAVEGPAPRLGQPILDPVERRAVHGGGGPLGGGAGDRPGAGDG